MYCRIICILSLFFLIACEEDQSEEEIYYFFQPNAYFMVADGQSTLTLNVFQNTVFKNRYNDINLVEEGVEFYYNGQAMNRNVFTTESVGEHVFYATYHEWKSEEIIITARAPKEYEVINIPLIFHLQYDDEPVGQGANISANDIENIVSIINQRFRNTYYTLNYPQLVQSPSHVDTQIEFRLAQYDPEGNLLDEPGIKRYGGYNATSWTSIELQEKFLSENMWSPYFYLNISVANQNITNKATLPVANYDHQFCGLERTDKTWEEYFSQNSQNGENVVYRGILMSLQGLYSHEKLTHELGHYMGLYHPFDFDCNIDRFPFGVDDCVEDTQFYNELEFSELQKSLTRLYYECNTNNLILHDNYMDYYRKSEPEISPTYYGFTYDQRDRMREILEHSPWIKELLSSPK